MMRALALVMLAGCGLPDTSDMFHQAILSTPSTAAEAHSSFVETMNGAERSLHVALARTDDPALTDALMDAVDRGVEVELVIDGDEANEATAALDEAGALVQLADTGVAFFDFSINQDVAWSSTQTMMSHNYVIADRKRFVTSTEAGRTEDGTRLQFEGRGEDLILDMLAEHNQLAGGVDATALTAFSSPAKSIADFRWMYPVDSDVNFEMWLGPQERVTKRIIDAVYSARASVWVLTDDFANDGLTKALQDKARVGFDVKVVVGPEFGRSNAPLSRELENETPDVAKRQVTDTPVVPTLVLIDYEASPINGRQYNHRAFLLTHDLYAATRLYRGLEVTSDQYIDSALWVLTDYNGLSPEMLELQSVWQAHFDRAGAL